MWRWRGRENGDTRRCAARGRNVCRETGMRRTNLARSARRVTPRHPSNPCLRRRCPRPHGVKRVDGRRGERGSRGWGDVGRRDAESRRCRERCRGTAVKMGLGWSSPRRRTVSPGGIAPFMGRVCPAGYFGPTTIPRRGWPSPRLVHPKSRRLATSLRIKERGRVVRRAGHGGHPHPRLATLATPTGDPAHPRSGGMGRSGRGSIAARAGVAFTPV